VVIEIYKYKVPVGPILDLGHRCTSTSYFEELSCSDERCSYYINTGTVLYGWVGLI
jgi:hypothetical protein